MPFRVQCECGARLTVKDELRGRRKTCPKCKQPITLLPAADPKPPTAAPKLPSGSPLKSPLVIALSAAAALCGISILAYTFWPSSPPAAAFDNAHVPPPPEPNPSIAARAADVPHSSHAQPAQATAVVPATETSLTNPVASALPATRIAESVLIAFMNTQIPGSPVAPDIFKLGTVQNEDTLDRVALYQNAEFGVYLMLTGPRDDLTVVSLIMPLTNFIGEESGKSTGDGAAAFGRCVQRVGAAADPAWVSELYGWMNDNMEHALLVPEGITLSHLHLLAKFSTFKAEDDKMMVSMAIGIPAEE